MVDQESASAVTQSHRPSMPFPVVGVGASAGGLAATTDLLRHLGDAPGVALVIVHHLDPSHESSLVEILSRATSLPVLRAVDGAQIAADHVYVVPPNAALRVVDGRLVVSPRGDVGGRHCPIDRFLESLAADRSAFAVGVVLTGTGSDGAEGIRAIKSEGGLTFAQDASAEYPGMPHAAIATGCVDQVLSPEAIAVELGRIGHLAPPGQSSSDDHGPLRRVLAAMHKQSGVDFARYKHTTILRRVQRRLFAKRLSTLREYADLLEQDESERTALCEDVLIHVTSFFRDPDVFEALKTHVFPHLLQGRAPNAPIRVWVPGCSTGEEAYSIAICLLEFMSDAGVELPLKVFGTDVSLGAIDRARTARYPETIEADVSPGRLQRFFFRAEAGFQIRKDVRDLCVFAKQDATRDPPFSGMDIVSCRNLMIYLGPALQERILPIFHYALKTPGFLVLGNTETIRSSPGFTTVDAKNKIYARTAAAPRPLFDFADPRTPGGTIPATHARAEGGQDVQREADRLVLAEVAPAGVVVTDDLAIVQFRGRTAPYLEPPPGTPSFDLMRMVAEDLRLPLRQAIDEARISRRPARRVGLVLPVAGDMRTVDLEILPFGLATTQQRFFVVLFRDATPMAPAIAPAPSEPEAPSLETQLRQELASTRNYLQSVIEQLEASNEELKAANEEIVSSNEELRSTNEELQMAKEELQATNEELRTVNDEMGVRNLEATRLGDDLSNVLSCIEIPIVLVGRDSRLRRFTPAAGRTFSLTGADLGRSIAEVGMPFRSSIAEMVTRVIEQLGSSEATLQDDAGRWYQLNVRPYLTVDNRVEGAVIAFVDIGRLKHAEALVAKGLLYSASVFDTVAEVLVVLDHDCRVRSVNRSYLRLFGGTSRDVEGRSLFDLGRGELDRPELRTLLADLGPEGRVDGFRLEAELPAHGPRVLLIGARRIENTTDMLLAIRDVTDAARAEGRIRDYKDRLEQMAFEAAVAEERERRRIAVGLHDRIGQSLALAQMKLTAVSDHTTAADRTAIDESIELLAQSVEDTRTLTFELSPPVLYDLGLKEALHWLADDVAKHQGIQVDIHDDALDKPLDETTSALMFRAVRELLANVTKHAKSPFATVSLRRDGDAYEISVRDEGVGFDPDAVASQAGFGLISVREQVRRLGGAVTIHSAPERGTHVSIRVPLIAKRTSDPPPPNPEAR